jgi:hypothetical protein
LVPVLFALLQERRSFSFRERDAASRFSIEIAVWEALNP